MKRRSIGTGWWVGIVLTLSFASYLPMLLDQSGAAVPQSLLYLRYGFILIPALASLLFSVYEGVGREYLLSGFRHISRREIVVWAILALVGILSVCVYSVPAEMNLFRAAYPSLAAFAGSCLYLFATAIVEELAWRRFLFRRILARGGRLRAALLTGAVWAVWHIPMWTVRNLLGAEEIAPLFLWAVLLSVVLGIFYSIFENILSAALLHMTFNVCYLMPALYNDILLLVGILLCTALWAYRKRR